MLEGTLRQFYIRVRMDSTEEKELFSNKKNGTNKWVGKYNGILVSV